MNPTLDQDVVYLSKALRKVESGTDPNAKGASGEFGAYQYIPDTWAKQAAEAGVNVPLHQSSLADQNKVFYTWAKKKKDEGYTMGQIISMHNAGEGKPNAYLEGNKGVNEYGVAYDTAEYARKVAETYQGVKGAVSPTPQIPSAPAPASGVPQVPPVAPPVEPSPQKSLGDSILGAGQAVSDFFGGKGVTDLIGGLIAKESLPEDQARFVDLPKPAQVIGSAAQLATLALPYGAVAKGLTTGARGLGMGARVAGALGTYGAGAGGGAIFGAGQALQEGQSFPEAAKTIGSNAAFGALAPAAIDVVGAGFRGLAGAQAKGAISKLERGYREAFGATKTGLKNIEKGARAGQDDAAFLAKKGITINLTDDATKYDTAQARQLLQNDMDALDDVLTDALKGTRGYVYIDDFEQKALKAIDNAANRAEGTLSARQAQVRKIANEYRKTYGDIVDLGTLNEIKRGQRRVSGIFDASRPHFATDVHYQVSNVAKDLIEDVAKGGGLPQVKGFNQYYGQHVNALKSLEKLHGNAVRGGRLGRYLTKHATGLAGSIAGTATHGPVGSILGLLAGEAAGGAVSKALAKNKVANPLQDAVLRRLAKEDPKVVQEVLEFLSKSSPNSMPRSTSMNAPIAPMVAGVAPQTKGLVQTLLEKNVAPGDKLIGAKGRQAVSEYLSNYVQNPRVGLQLENVARKKAQGGVPETPAFQGFQDLSTKLLEKLKGRTTVSRQFISDLTNSPDLKQAEKDLVRKALEDAGDEINVPDFANRVKSELLPLTRKNAGAPDNMADWAEGAETASARYENINLPDDLRGPVANYYENIYESPISTSAGGVHFGSDSKNYFAHSRIEDLPDNASRRVIEIQSDLFQKGRLEGEAGQFGVLRGDESRASIGEEELAKRLKVRDSEIAKLEPYRNTWHERVIREEVKQAAKDGKTKLQFPTGETAMKIEGLGETFDWVNPATKQKLTPDVLKVGTEIDHPAGGNEFIITDVLGDGKFKAVPKSLVESYEKIKSTPRILESKIAAGDDIEGAFERSKETFDISGKVDTENPIYKFYEKTVAKYLTNKYGGKVVTDPQGVKWVEIDVKPEMARIPVEAFGIAAPIGLIPSLLEQKQQQQ